MGKENHLFWQMGNSKSHSLVKASSPTNHPNFVILNRVPSPLVPLLPRSLSRLLLTSLLRRDPPSPARRTPLSSATSPLLRLCQHPKLQPFPINPCIQEENVDQSSCTLSLSSTLTQCTSLATVQHKKRTRDSDCESDCDSRFYSPTNMQQQVVGDRDLNEEELFNQLFKARLGHPPYGKYKSWDDIALWEEIVKELGSHSLFHNPTITDVLKVVIKYYKEYKSDPELIQKRLSHSLRLNIRQVFDSFTDKYGSLTFDALETVHSLVRPQSSQSGEIIEYKNDAQALEELLKVCEEKARRILPSTSDRMGIREYRKERGFAGPVALQYGEDLTALGINDDEKVWLVQKFNSASDEYLSLANHPLHTRLNFFRKILQHADTTILETECPSHQSSNAKSSKRRKAPRINS